MPPSLRFGVGISGADSRAALRDKARKAEDLGYDVILVPDHLGMPAPFPTLIALADATNRVRVGTLVLNAGFYTPALLARDAAAAHLLTGGRFDLGLGAGPDFAKPEFDAAGLPFPHARHRIDHLDRTITEVRALSADDHQPPVYGRIPLLVAGNGDRLLRVAAKHADTVAIAGVPVAPGIDSPAEGTAALARRLDFIRAAAASRPSSPQLSLMVQAVVVDDGAEADLSLPRMFNPQLSDEQLLHLPGVLHGTAQDIADTLQHYRDTYSVTYYTITETAMTALAKVIALLR